MDSSTAEISTRCRKAIYRGDWLTVDVGAKALLEQNCRSAEGHFLAGLVAKAANQPAKATALFARALKLDDSRYDAAIELANQHCIARRNAEAAALTINYERHLGNSPVYLNLAGTIYSDIGMPERSWPLFRRANELQPGVDIFQANLAACGVYLGKIDEATRIFKNLLTRYPAHQRNHYQLCRLRKATDTRHIDQMKEILRSTNMTPDKNIFLYYAIGKELEDLESWDESFHFYKMAGDAIADIADYEVETDIRLIERIIATCNAEWLFDCSANDATSSNGKIPIFVVGLPRTGTTLTERIITSHSKVQSVGETQYMQMVVRRVSEIDSREKITPAMISSAAEKYIRTIGDGYLQMLQYRLGSEPMFVDKLPFNILYLGFIAKAFPQARIVHVVRNPMDSCFSMYKQVFTWAYKYSYTLEDLGRFYVAYDRLVRHWQSVLGGRMIEIHYESLVADPVVQTGQLLSEIGLEMEEACLNFYKNSSASATASSVQVREKIHARSVNRWANFSRHLRPLREHLERSGIEV